MTGVDLQVGTKSAWRGAVWQYDTLSQRYSRRAVMARVAGVYKSNLGTQGGIGAGDPSRTAQEARWSQSEGRLVGDYRPGWQGRRWSP